METSIYIKSLHKNVDVAILCDAFRVYGKILSASIELDNNSESIGKAEIKFDNYSSAVSSVRGMNGNKILNKQIVVSLSVDIQPFTKVFVKNLSKVLDEADLTRIFSTVGNVVNAFISEENGKSNGYGYVKFQKCADAEKALKYLNDKEICGQKILVERYKRKPERENIIHNSIEYAEVLLRNSIQKNNLYIKNLPKDMTDFDLKSMFQKFGPIKSHKISCYENGRSQGVGFVCFERVEDANRALKKTNGIILNGKKIEVNFKQDGFARHHYLSLKGKEAEVQRKNYKQLSKSASALQFYPHAVQHTLMKI